MVSSVVVIVVKYFIIIIYKQGNIKRSNFNKMCFDLPLVLKTLKFSVASASDRPVMLKD